MNQRTPIIQNNKWNSPVHQFSPSPSSPAYQNYSDSLILPPNTQDSRTPDDMALPFNQHMGPDDILGPDDQVLPPGGRLLWPWETRQRDATIALIMFVIGMIFTFLVYTPLTAAIRAFLK